MKKYLKFFAGFMLLAAMTSCTQQKKYTVSGQIPETGFEVEGNSIYLYDFLTKDIIDSTTVIKSAFEFNNSVEKPQLAVFSVSPQEQIFFVLENENLTLDFSTLKVVGSVNNDALNVLNDKIAETSKILNAISADLQQSELSDEAKQETWTTEFAKYKKTIASDFTEAYKGHENTPVGLYVLLNASSIVEPEVYKEMMMSAGPDVASVEYIQKQLAAIKALESTAVGKMFVDFSATKEDGTEQHFSDVVGKGKYVLVDFWASWCGPCMREVPNLKEIYKQYAGDNFEILGVAVWDKEEASSKSILDEDMTWKMMLNTQNIATDLYGITGIPQIMLFGPDGTILKKDLRGAAIGVALKEIFGK